MRIEPWEMRRLTPWEHDALVERVKRELALEEARLGLGA